MPFPKWGLRSIEIGSKEIVKELKVKVYCSCIKCSEWFHQNCENIVDLSLVVLVKSNSNIIVYTRTL